MVQPPKQTKPLPLQQKTATSSGLQAAGLSEVGDSRITSHALKDDSKPKSTKHTETTPPTLDLFTSELPTIPDLNERKLLVKVDTNSEVAVKPQAPSESISKTTSEAEARREKNRLKKEKKKERKRKEKEQALARTSS